MVAESATVEAVSPLAGLRQKLLSRRVAMIAIPILVTGLIGGVAAMLFSRSDTPEVVIEMGGPPTFYTLPTFDTDLMPENGRDNHVRLEIVLVVPADQLAQAKTKELEVINEVRKHLRTFTRKALVGRAGDDRLRLDLLPLVNEVLAPVEARDILFTQFLLD